MTQQIKIYDTNKIDEKLNGKANSFHTHSISQVTDLQNQLNSKASISDRDFIVSIMGSDSPSSNVWYQFFEMTTSGWGNYNFLLYVSCGYQRKEAGILKVSIRTDNPNASLWDFSWLVRESETNVNNFLAHVEGNKVKLYCYNTPSQYGRTFIKVLSANDINGTPLSDSNVRKYFLNGVPIKLTAKPTFTHTSTDISHSIASVTGLQDALNSKSNSNHTHNSILDKYDSRVTTFAYSQSELPYESFTWLAGWNGSELRVVNKNLFATTSHKHAITDVTGLQTKLDDITNLSSRLSSLTSDVATLEQETISINTIFGDESSNSIYIESFDSSARDSIQFKTINGNNIVGTGNVTISASVPTANQTTPGIFKVMGYNPVSTTNWIDDNVVLTGKALDYLVRQGVLDKNTSGDYIASISFGGYHGPYTANTNNTKIKDLYGGANGVFYVIWGFETREHGHISVQKKTTFYTDYDCVAYSSGDHGYWGKSYLTVTVYVPANTYYYLFGQNVEKVYINYYQLN